MLHIYRQIVGLKTFRPIVFAQKREHATEFPVSDLILLPRPVTREFRRFWQKKIKKAPVQISQNQARQIGEKLREVDAKLLHIYFGHIGVHLLPLIQMRALPTIVSFHGADAMVDMEKSNYREAMQRMLRDATMVLARSQSLAEQLVELGCAREKLRLHRTGIPLDQFPFRQREPAAGGAWNFLQACRLIPKKGLRVSLRAFAGFAKKFPAATLTIAGEGAMREELAALAQELGVEKKVRFTGFVAQEQLRDLFYDAHAFLHPSELGPDGNQEGVPNSMLEAMATGLPAFATTHGGIPEAVENGVSGLLVDERDHAALARAMIELADSPERYRAMSRQAASAVAQKFEMRAQIRNLENYYAEALRV